MRKILFSLTLLSVLILFTNCSDNKPEEPSTTPIISISIAPSSIEAGKEGIITLTSNIDAPQDIVITLSSSSVTNVTVDAELTIKEGTKSVDGKFSSLAKGKSTISIACDTEIATISEKEGSAEVEVIGGEVIEKKNIIYQAWGKTSDTSLEVVKCKIATNDTSDKKFNIFNVCFHETGWKGEKFAGWRISFDNFGAEFVGETKSFGKVVTLHEAGVTINDKLAWLTNPDHIAADLGKDTGDGWMCAPYLWVKKDFISLVGKSGYVVAKFLYSDTKNGVVLKQYPGWVKVKVKDTSTDIVEFAINVGGGTFTTGQKE